MKALRGLASLGLAYMLAGGQEAIWEVKEIPFVPTPMEIVDRMLEMAEVKTGDIVYDLGSGDGRIVIRAAPCINTRSIFGRSSRKLNRSTREDRPIAPC